MCILKYYCCNFPLRDGVISAAISNAAEVIFLTVVLLKSKSESTYLSEDLFLHYEYLSEQQDLVEVIYVTTLLVTAFCFGLISIGIATKTKVLFVTWLTIHLIKLILYTVVALLSILTGYLAHLVTICYLVLSLYLWIIVFSYLHNFQAEVKCEPTYVKNYYYNPNRSPWWAEQNTQSGAYFPTGTVLVSCEPPSTMMTATEMRRKEPPHLKAIACSGMSNQSSYSSPRYIIRHFPPSSTAL
uniref:Uncharacterized protein n=1 Tax=Strigamia maritima TaxID=126957 RepID=T1J586_STRMM